MLWGKGNNQVFQGILNTDYELTPVPGDAKCLCGPQSEQGLKTNGVFTQVHLTVGPVGPETHFVIISPGPE